MLDAINRLQTVLSQASHYLLTPSKAFYKPQPQVIFFDLDDDRENHFSLPRKSTLQIDDISSKIVVFNSHARRRGEIVTVKVSMPNIKVYKINNVEGDDEEEVIASQLSPVFDDETGQILNNEFYLSFLAQVKGLALQTFYVKQLKPEDGTNTYV